jgi:hypothetical protein
MQNRSCLNAAWVLPMMRISSGDNGCLLSPFCDVRSVFPSEEGVPSQRICDFASSHGDIFTGIVAGDQFSGPVSYLPSVDTF